MPRRVPFSITQIITKARTQSLHFWPPKLSLPTTSYRVRSSRRSQLRLAPIASSGRLDQWVFQLLLNVQELLEKGQRDDALELCQEEISFASFQRGTQYDCYHRAISLFTRHNDFAAAMSLCKRMISDGFILHIKTLMVLLRGMKSHDVKHVEQVQSILTSGAMELDDLAFKSILDSMLLYRYSPMELESALEVYATLRGPDWIAPPSVYGIIIQSHSLVYQLDKAQEWLDKYRETLANQRKRRIRSPTSTTKDNGIVIFSGPTLFERRWKEKLRRRSGAQASSEDFRFPYAAVLMGYAKSPNPLPSRIDWLFERMRKDDVSPDVTMCNMLITTFFQWGWARRARAIYQSMLSHNNSTSPDAYTFRHIFVALNPKRDHGPNEIDPPEDLITRQVFKDMIHFWRLRLHPRKPQRHKNIISAATFNCALATFTAQGDYAAAWTVLSCFTRHHIAPDMDTKRNVILSLLRRMRGEFVAKTYPGDVLWIHMLLGDRSSTTTPGFEPTRQMLGDQLFAVGRRELARLKTTKYETYLKPSLEIRGADKEDMYFFVALLRVALQASLGFPSHTQRRDDAGKAIKKAMLQARSDMIPHGRTIIDI